MPAAAGTGWLIAGRYRVLDRLGAGGMAEVFRAHDDLLGRDVAVKVFRGQLDPADSAGGRQRQEVELRTLAQLSHPNLITLFDGSLGETGGPAYLVMELVAGLSLAERIADRPLTGSEAALVGAQISDALSYVHSRGMVHRDVKPANILLGIDAAAGAHAGHAEDPAAIRARLSDFGIVRLLDSEHLTSVDFMVGTASYLSPEQARGAEVGAAADVYSLGLVLIEALTGVRSFPGTPMEAVHARLAGPPEIPSSLPAPWPALLATMTGLDPATRPAAAEVAQILRAGSATGAMPVTARARPAAAVASVAAPTLALSRAPAAMAEPAAVPAAGGANRRGPIGWLLAVVLVGALAAAGFLLSRHPGGSNGPGTVPSVPVTVSKPATSAIPSGSADASLSQSPVTATPPSDSGSGAVSTGVTATGSTGQQTSTGQQPSTGQQSSSAQQSTSTSQSSPVTSASASSTTSPTGNGTGPASSKSAKHSGGADPPG